jgi:sugar-specific transcriptional regulator TrmB
MSPCLRLGQLKIKDIAINSGAPRIKVYGVVKSLAGKGTVEIVGKDPVFCTPIMSEEVFTKRLNHRDSMSDSEVEIRLFDKKKKRKKG